MEDTFLYVRGEAQYADDFRPPKGMLYAAVFASPVARGEILSLETTKAKNAPGVVEVLCANDIPGENQIGPIFPDEPLLAEKTVHYQGQPLALVIAQTPQQAQQARDLISAEIQAQRPIVDPKEAFEKGEIIGSTRTFEMGNVQKAFEECDIVVEGTAQVGGQEHLYLETQRCRAIPLESGNLLVRSSTQSPYAVQKAVARILNLAQHQVEVEVLRLGGGFGGKEDQATPWACLAALGAWKLQQPVELVLHRLDDMKMTGKRHPYISEFKLGLNKNGKILAYEVQHFQNAGAFADLSSAVLERTLFHSTGAYFIPNVRIFAASCRTNLPPNTAFRGFGGPQGMFVIECAIAKAAETMGKPRAELQAQNLLQEGDLFPYGQRLERANLRTCWQKLQTKILQKQEKIQNFNQTHRLEKKGYALMPVCFGISFTSTFLNQASSLVHIYTDGSVSISTGGVEMGQGFRAKIRHIASQALGISPKRIQILSTNTTRIANMSPSAASATTDLNGNATLLAIQQLLHTLKTLLAKEIGTDDPQAFTIQEEKIYYKGSQTAWNWERLIQNAYLQRKPLSAYGYYTTPHIWFDKSAEKGRPFAYHAFGVALIEAKVDLLRGRYTIETVDIVHDLGRPLLPIIDQGQVEGALAQGLGWMTVEELKYDNNGRLLSSNLATYKAPDLHFMPKELHVEFLEDSYNPSAPYGSKAVGEPPLMYGIGAFFAIREAMKAGASTKNFNFIAPLTPERVLTQLYSTTSKKESTPLQPQATGKKS
ncbi:MAG: xanthine dehydrogenase [Planctomycetota bacterium]|nr:MAG: xanthine dehydrogenase [Planctomycetota bacterium]